MRGGVELGVSVSGCALAVTNLSAGHVLWWRQQGTEDANGQPMSTAAQVRRLIDEARDPDNLAPMFYGWGSWL